MPTASALRFGIALAIDTNFIAATPQGVHAPTVRLPDGSERTLTPSRIGVVSAEGLPRGPLVALYGPGGARRSQRLTG